MLIGSIFLTWIQIYLQLVHLHAALKLHHPPTKVPEGATLGASHVFGFTPTKSVDPGTSDMLSQEISIVWRRIRTVPLSDLLQGIDKLLWALRCDRIPDSFAVSS
jgi:hypothetical protein